MKEMSLSVSLNGLNPGKLGLRCWVRSDERLDPVHVFGQRVPHPCPHHHLEMLLDAQQK